jgi:hypothetical protein
VADIALKVHDLLAILDNDLSASQLAATFALRNRQPAAAVEKATASDLAFDKAEELFDELMRAIIDQRDKLPVQDPIASLLEDPTLDELLAELENETRLTDILGIPERPTNLQTIMDWLRPGKGNGGGIGRMLTSQMERDATRIKQEAEEARQRAVARALKEQERYVASALRDSKTNGKRAKWNTLLSTLRDDLRQGKGELPPQEYRRAIEQYMAAISRIEAAQAGESEPPPK